jgi:hypothetical protein
MIATRGETVRASGGGSKVAALDAAGWLLLAAAPTFAIMALLTGVLGSGRADMLCSAAHGEAHRPTPSNRDPIHRSGSHLPPKG